MHPLLRKITNTYLRKDLPSLRVGEKIKVNTKNGHSIGTIISLRRKNEVNCTFTIIEETGKVILKKIYSYNSPTISSIEKTGKPMKVRRAKLFYLERSLAKKKANE